MDFIKGAYDAARQKVDSYVGSDVEKAVKAATSNENWGASNTMKNEIAQFTYDYNDCKEVMAVIWKRLEEKGINWRIVFKSLQLLEYLLKNGHERVAQECRDCQFRLRAIHDFQFYDAENRDRGRGIRDLSKLVVELAGDSNRLKSERREAEKTRKKLNVGGGGGGWNNSNDGCFA